MQVFKYLGEHKAAFALTVVLLMAGALCDLAIPGLTASIVDVGIQELGGGPLDVQMDYLLTMGAAMLGLAVASTVLTVAVSLVSARTGAVVGRDLRRKLFERVMSLSDAEMTKFSATSLITRGTNDIQLIQSVIVLLLSLVLFAPIVAVGGIAMMLFINSQLGWIVAVAVVAVALVAAVFFRITLPKFKMVQKLVDRVNLVAREMLTGIQVSRAYGRSHHEQARFDAASRELMVAQLFTGRAMSFMMPLMTLIMNGVSAAIVWFGGLSVGEGAIQTGDLIAFITYAMVIIMGFLMIGMVAIVLPRADVAAERVNEVLACEPSVCDPKPEEACALAAGLPGARIAFEDVSFRYSADSEPALEHVSFVAEPGSALAIVGATGSGKSTVIKLIERFYDPTEGRVTVDGVDVRSLPQRELRAVLGYVPQKAFLFSGTVDANVAYGDEAMTKACVRRALNVAQASSFVDGRPEKANAPISQGGTNVSGGQRQRLSIARALATGARALLFDDSFSALDYRTDAQLRRALQDEFGDVTRIIVAQRVSTVLAAERIVVLDGGRVAGQGTHDELMLTCPAYREIALSQLSSAELGMGGDTA